MTARTLLALLLAPALLGLGALALCPGGTCRAGALDAGGLALAALAHGPAADAFFRAITWGGSVWVLGPLALLHALWCLRHHPPLRACFVPLALGSAVLLAHAAKLLIARERPAVPPLIDMPADASFPSAHALQISAFVVACWLAPGRRPGAQALAWGLAAMVLVAWPRLHLQVHFPSDIAFGLAAGVAWVLALRQLPPWRAPA